MLKANLTQPERAAACCRAWNAHTKCRVCAAGGHQGSAAAAAALATPLAPCVTCMGWFDTVAFSTLCFDSVKSDGA